jgi:RNA polymerase sigma-70 factor, ECF subfamily
MKAIQNNIETLYIEELPKLKSYLYRLICDREIVQDIAHDTFVKAIEKQDQYKGESSLQTWIFSIATNTAIDYLRKKQRWPVNAQDKARELAESNNKYRNRFIEINQQSAQGAFEIKEHISFCFTCIAKTLPIEQQVTLILKDVYEFKIDEISDILSCPKGTTKHRLFEARKTMDQIFYKRCALINKNGICYQCSELNDFFNSPVTKQNTELKTDSSDKKKNWYTVRAILIKNIDPFNSEGSVLEDEIMQVLRKAIGEK